MNWNGGHCMVRKQKITLLRTTNIFTINLNNLALTTYFFTNATTEKIDNFEFSFFPC